MVDKDLENLTISEVAPKIRSGEVSPVALTKLYIERIERLNPLLSAYLTPTPESALEEAAAAEKEIRSGGYRGPLHGIPVSIKDNFATRGVRTTAGAKALSDWKPDFDATVVTRLREAGAVSLGKTNMHEWAKGSHGVNPFYGTPCNPWDRNRIPAAPAADRRWPWPRACAWRPSAPTPRARSEILPLCAASSGSSPPTGASACSAACRAREGTPPTTSVR